MSNVRPSPLPDRPPGPLVQFVLDPRTPAVLGDEVAEEAGQQRPADGLHDLEGHVDPRHPDDPPEVLPEFGGREVGNGDHPAAIPQPGADCFGDPRRTGDRDSNPPTLPVEFDQPPGLLGRGDVVHEQGEPPVSVGRIDLPEACPQSAEWGSLIYTPDVVPEGVRCLGQVAVGVPTGIDEEGNVPGCGRSEQGPVAVPRLPAAALAGQDEDRGADGPPVGQALGQAGASVLGGVGQLPPEDAGQIVVGLPAEGRPFRERRPAEAGRLEEFVGAYDRVPGAGPPSEFEEQVVALLGEPIGRPDPAEEQTVEFGAEGVVGEAADEVEAPEEAPSLAVGQVERFVRDRTPLAEGIDDLPEQPSGGVRGGIPKCVGRAVVRVRPTERDHGVVVERSDDVRRPRYGWKFPEELLDLLPPAAVPLRDELVFGVRLCHIDRPVEVRQDFADDLLQGPRPTGATRLQLRHHPPAGVPGLPVPARGGLQDQGQLLEAVVEQPLAAGPESPECQERVEELVEDAVDGTGATGRD